jgi:hypothetical protein
MRNIVLLIAISLAFCLTELTLTHFLPLAKTDFDVWLQYFIAKDAVYDTMFFLFSLLLFWNVKKPAEKAITFFLIIVTCGSFADKVIAKLNQYLFSDIVLISVGLIISVILYFKWKTQKPG